VEPLAPAAYERDVVGAAVDGVVGLGVDRIARRDELAPLRHLERLARQGDVR
jgi:hypothetical protein